MCPTSSGSGAHDGGGSTGSGKGGTRGSTGSGTGGRTGGGDPSSSSEADEHSDDDGEVVAALFSQHNFDALYNCTAGECEFEGLPGPLSATLKPHTPTNCTAGECEFEGLPSPMSGGGNDGGGDREVREAWWQGSAKGGQRWGGQGSARGGKHTLLQAVPLDWRCPPTP